MALCGVNTITELIVIQKLVNTSGRIVRGRDRVLHETYRHANEHIRGDTCQYKKRRGVFIRIRVVIMTIIVTKHWKNARNTTGRDRLFRRRRPLPRNVSPGQLSRRIALVAVRAPEDTTLAAAFTRTVAARPRIQK